jgi:prepilin-type N-terminal cleavage/methylation domain-containing protein
MKLKKGFKTRTSQNRGFTLIEILVVIGLFSALTAIAVINLTRPQSKASVDSAATTLISDLKQQQLLSMLGDSGSQASAQAHGVRLESGRYILFTGPSFASSSNQFIINLPQGISLSSPFLPVDIIFTPRSGETTALSNIVLSDTASDHKNLGINRLGVININ